MAATPLIAATAAKAQEALKRRKVRFVHVGLFDYDGCFRERRLPLDLARLAFDGKLEWCNNVRGWDSADAMWDPRPVAGEAVRIDPTSGRDYGFEDDAALYVADYIGVSAQASPRNLLAAQIKKADAMGYAVRCAFECELFILDETAASLREKNFDNLDFFAPDNRCWDGMPAAETPASSPISTPPWRIWTSPSSPSGSSLARVALKRPYVRATPCARPTTPPCSRSLPRRSATGTA